MAKNSNKRAAAGLIALGLLLALTGCAQPRASDAPPSPDQPNGGTGAPPIALVTPAVDDSPSPTPKPTPTGTPTAEWPNGSATPTPTETSEPPPTRTPTPSDTPTLPPTQPPAETATPTPEEIAAPAIEGYTLKQNLSTGRWEYYRDKELVAYTTSFHLADEPVYYSEKPAEFKTANAIVVTDAKLMEQLIREGNTKAEVDAGRFRIPLPFDPTGVEMRLMKHNSTITTFALTVPPEFLSKFAFVQPFPGSVTAFANKYGDAENVVVVFPEELGLIPRGWHNVFVSMSYKSGRRNSQIALNLAGKTGYGKPAVTNLIGQLPPRYRVGNATAVLSIGSFEGGRSFGMDNLLNRDSFLVTAAAPAS